MKRLVGLLVLGIALVGFVAFAAAQKDASRPSMADRASPKVESKQEFVERALATLPESTIEPQIVAELYEPRGPMTVEQAKSMAENMLEDIVAVMHPTGSPQVVGVPSVVPTGNCVDGVCLDLVHSLNEYLSSQPRGLHRFQFQTIAGENNELLFAVITGGTIQTRSPSIEEIQKFFKVESVVPLAELPEAGARRDEPRGPMTVEQAKGMADNLLEDILALMYPTDSPQVIGVPSVVPTGNCVDGVCLDVVRSKHEYFSSQPRGLHRFQFMTIVTENDDMLFAVITGGTIQTQSPNNEQIQQFFDGGDSQTAAPTAYCTPEVFGWKACVIIDDEDPAVCLGVCDDAHCYTVCWLLE